MTCDQCVRAVTAEISKISGVERVDVDLASGVVTVGCAEPLDLDARWRLARSRVRSQWVATITIKGNLFWALNFGALQRVSRIE